MDAATAILGSVCFVGGALAGAVFLVVGLWVWLLKNWPNH